MRSRHWLVLHLFMILLGLFACDPQRPEDLSREERASVIVMRGEVDPEDNETVIYVPVCGGVAISEKAILTAAHCMEDDQAEAYFVDADTWLTTGRGRTLARVERLPGDLAFLVPVVDLRHHVPVVSASDGAATLVRLRETELYSSEAIISGDHILSPMVEHGDSGWGLFQDGACVGVMLTCTSPDDATCSEDGGRFGSVVSP